MKTKIKLSSMFMAIALCHSQSFAQEKNQDKSAERTFIGLTFHDVRDDVLKQGDKDVYAVSTRNLVQFFEWLKDSPWHPISLKEIDKKPEITIDELSKLISVETRTIERKIRQLKEKNLLERKGSDKNGEWVIKK